MAITSEPNSQLMSTSSRPTVSVTNQSARRKKTALNLTPKGWFRGKKSKDPDAVEWEPPKLAENVDLGKTIVDR